MNNFERIKEMDKYELAEWLFIFGLNCVGMGKGDIVRMLEQEDASLPIKTDDK